MINSHSDREFSWFAILRIAFEMHLETIWHQFNFSFLGWILSTYVFPFPPFSKNWSHFSHPAANIWLMISDILDERKFTCYLIPILYYLWFCVWSSSYLGRNTCSLHQKHYLRIRNRLNLLSKDRCIFSGKRTLNERPSTDFADLVDNTELPNEKNWFASKESEI